MTSELVVLTLFAVVRTLCPSIPPDIGALIRHGNFYLRGSNGHPGHYGLVAGWAAGLLAVAAAVAYLATVPKVRRPTERIMGPYPHDSTVSAWWILFEKWPQNRDVQVACILDDGSGVRGRFGSFNTAADDSPDRDLILQEPIYYRPPGEKSQEVLYDVSAVCCPASRITALFVTYSDPQAATPAQQAPQQAVPGVLHAGSGAAMTSEASTPELQQPSLQQLAAGPAAPWQRRPGRHPWRFAEIRVLTASVLSRLLDLSRLRSPHPHGPRSKP